MKNLLLSILSLLCVFSSIDAKKMTFKEFENFQNKHQPPENIFKIINLQKGMTVGEIGAGKGRYTIEIARYVGNEGIVYANDIEKKALLFIKKRCDKLGINNRLFAKFNIPSNPLLKLV